MQEEELLADAVFFEIKWRSKNRELTKYQPLLRAQRRACVALKHKLEDEYGITDPEPSRVESWLMENVLGFYFRVEYRLPPAPEIVMGTTAGTPHQVTICLDFQLTIDHLRDENGAI